MRCKIDILEATRLSPHIESCNIYQSKVYNLTILKKSARLNLDVLRHFSERRGACIYIPSG